MSGLTSCDLELQLCDDCCKEEQPDEAFLLDYINGAWWGALNLEPNAYGQQQDPLRQVLVGHPGCAAGHVVLRFRSAGSAEVALQLNGLLLRGHRLRLRRVGGSTIKMPTVPSLEQIQQDHTALRRVLEWGPTEEALSVPDGCHWKGGYAISELRGFADIAPESHYDILQVDRRASSDEIRTGFRHRASDPNSDKGELTEACRTLVSPDAKANYDHKALQFVWDAVRAAKNHFFQPAVFVVRNIDRLRQGLVKRINVLPRHLDYLFGQAQSFGTRSRGADLCILPERKFLPSEVWVAGESVQIRDVEGLVARAGEEADGLRATPDGAILTVPKALQDKLPQGKERDQLICDLYQSFQVTLTFVEDRMILRGGGGGGGGHISLSRAIANIQSRVIWRAEVKLMHGTYHAWEYALWAENFGIEVVPDREPDWDEAWRVLTDTSQKLQLPCPDQWASGIVRIVKALTDREAPIGRTILKILTSRCAYGAVKDATPVYTTAMCSLMRLWSRKQLTQNMGAFVEDRLLKVLWKVGITLSSPQPLHCTLAVLTVVRFAWSQMADQQAWLPWSTIVPLVKDHVHALLYNVAKELSLEVDASWAVDHNVVFFVTEYMLHHEFTVHEAGIRQAPAVAWQQYAGMPGMMAQAHIAAANAARSAAGPPPAPPAQPAPQKREADPASQPAKARRTTSEEEFEQQVNSAPTEKVAELLADASCKEPLTRRMATMVRSLFKKIESASRGSAEDLRDRLKSSVIEVVEAIGLLQDKLAMNQKKEANEGAALWELSKGDFQKCCLKILHAANLELLDKQGHGLEKKFWHGATREPFGSLLLTADCKVIESLCNTATDLAALEPICVFVHKLRASSERFALQELPTLLSEAAGRICRQGPPTPESFKRVVQALQNLGVPGCLDDLVQTLQAWGALQKLAPQDSPAEVADYFMGAAARLEAPQILDLPLFADAARFSAFPPQNLASMAVNAFQITQTQRWKEIETLRGRLLDSAVKKASAARYGDLCHKTAWALAELAARHKLLEKVKESPAMFVCIQGSSIQEMMKLPGLMVDNGIHSHVISSVFAAQVLEFCCQKKTKADFANIIAHLRKAVKILQDAGALRYLRGFLHGLSSLSALIEHAKSGGNDKDRSLPELVGTLLNAPKSRCTQGARIELDKLVAHVETAIQALPKRRGGRWATQDLMEAIKAKDDPKLRKFQDQCGPCFFAALLVNSNLLLESDRWRKPFADEQQLPSHRAAISLAGELANLRLEPGDLSKDEDGHYALLIRVTGELLSEEPVITFLLAGLYGIAEDERGENDSPVFVKWLPKRTNKELQVKIYYQDNMWWIGPEVGDDLVWARAPVHLREVPPRRGWIWQQGSSNDPGRKVQIKALRLDDAPGWGGCKGPQPEPKQQPIAAPHAGNVVRSKARPTTRKEAPQQEAKRQDTAAVVKRPHAAIQDQEKQQPQSKRARSFSEWLDGFDAKGVFREAYLQKLSEEFDSFEDLKAVYTPDGTCKGPVVSSVDPEFWKVLSVKTLAHKLVWARQLSAL